MVPWSDETVSTTALLFGRRIEVVLCIIKTALGFVACNTLLTVAHLPYWAKRLACSYPPSSCYLFRDPLL